MYCLDLAARKNGYDQAWIGLNDMPFFSQEILALKPFKAKKDASKGPNFGLNREKSKQPPYFPDSEWQKILSENDRRFWARKYIAKSVWQVGLTQIWLTLTEKTLKKIAG